ncbi:TRAP transporter substrate-binding protein DctP [Citreicella sp. C3M06]|uniref:TRAP transporter substrate-binding protein DctP n=1 Tax=Roseobacteraceae TaxID=2854170 RepID=UPI001C096CC8|nr:MULTISPECIES: TRAP transporter substrate-binding protein DctP [Roseobacteraceae]MBU2961335.1 TRAP transporter substrate-binding protein DctP [Citreicella sp. C3M06]MDO6584762.1 TRAP transporter substrate-binding protein DctP [Salipiger sp. 1_MG-2023]
MRNPIILSALAALSLGTAAPAANVDGPSVFWKISMYGNARALTSGMEALAEKVAAETDGKFQIRIFYAEQLGPAREALDAIKLNAFEGAGICNFYHPGKNPAWMVFSLPFLPITSPAVDLYVRKRMFEHPAIVADMEKWNALPYASGLLPQYEMMGRGEPPQTLDDWAGLQVRAGGGLGDAMELLGATKQTLSAGETLTAFQNGTVDVAAFPFTYAHVAFKINEEADWYTANLSPGSSECGWVLNKTAFEALPEQYQALVWDNRDLVLETELAAYAAQDEKNIPLFEKTLTKIEYDDAALEEFRTRAGRPIWDKWVADNPDFDAQGVLDAFLGYANEAHTQ